MVDTQTATAYGAHSEVGKLRKVLVCAPGMAHSRLTPSNAADLLFDDVMWVQKAQRDHFDFIAKLRERGVEVVELHNLLTETMEIPEAKAWLLDRKITPVAKLTEFLAQHQASGDLNNRYARCLGNIRNRPGCARIHFQHIQLSFGNRELDIH